MLMTRLAVLLPLLLLAAEVSATEKKLKLLKKLFKKDPKKCDIIWTEKIWPECTVTQEKVRQLLRVYDPAAGVRRGV